jgi:uncharacterized protein YuzE
VREEPAVNVRFDEEADALYIQLGDAHIIESEDVQPGIKILSVSRNIPGFNPKLDGLDVA